MDKGKQKPSGSDSGVKGMGCCRVEALLGIDERGQMVLPKELRDRANIKAGDKLALISWQKDGEGERRHMLTYEAEKAPRSDRALESLDPVAKVKQELQALGFDISLLS